MRVQLALISLVALAACEPSVPDSGSGVGFGDYNTYAAQREAQLSGAPVGEAGRISGERVAGQTVAGAEVPTDPNVESHADISDEQSFAAVAERETIESDAARLAENRAQYVVIQPTALPPRPDGSGASVVEYALRTTNPVGVPLYRRMGFNAENRFNRNCAEYASGERAQEAFLDAGGPDRDRMGLDPDGDGFACYFDPAPFRAARDAAVPAADPATGETDVIGIAGAALESAQ